MSWGGLLRFRPFRSGTAPSCKRPTKPDFARKPLKTKRFERNTLKVIFTESEIFTGNFYRVRQFLPSQRPLRQVIVADECLRHGITARMRTQGHACAGAHAQALALRELRNKSETIVHYPRHGIIPHVMRNKGESAE